jgi:hypothetical protein
MTRIHIQTSIDSVEYEKFKRKMAEFQLTEYELLKQYVIFCNNDTSIPVWLRKVRAVKEFLKYDLKQTSKF